MQAFCKQVLFLSLSITLAACGGGGNPDRDAANRVPDQQKIGGQKFAVISSTPSLRFAPNGTLEGEGSVRAAEALTSAANNYALRFELGENGSLALIDHGSMSLGEGLSLEFRREGATGRLLVFASAGGETRDLSSAFTAARADSALTLSVDVHGDESPAHLLLWNDSVSRAAEPVYNSGLVRRGSPGQGRGTSWGLSLANAKVSEAGVQKPRSSDN